MSRDRQTIVNVADPDCVVVHTSVSSEETSSRQKAGKRCGPIKRKVKVVRSKAQNNDDKYSDQHSTDTIDSGTKTDGDVSITEKQRTKKRKRPRNEQEQRLPDEAQKTSRTVRQARRPISSSVTGKSSATVNQFN